MPISVPSYDVNARAKTAADVKYGGAEAQINRAVDSAKMQEIAQKAALDQYGAAGRGVIGSTFNDLYGNLQANITDTAAQLGNQADIVGRGYRDATTLAQTARQQSQDRLAGLAGTIGLNQVQQAENLSPIEQLTNKIVGENAQYDATRTGNLRTWAGQQDALLREGLSQSRREGADRASSFENELVAALADLQARSTNQQYGLQGSLLDLLKERGAFQTGVADDYIDQLFGQQMQAAQYNLSEQEAQSQAAARSLQSALAEKELAFKERAYGDSRSDTSLENQLSLAREGRAQRESDLDLLLKQTQLGKLFEPQDLNEWAAQSGVDDNALNALLDEYNRATNEIAIANSLDYSALGSDDPQRELMKYLGASPQSVLLDRLSEGLRTQSQYYQPGGAGPSWRVGSPGKQLLTAAQIREASKYLGQK